MVKAKTWWRLFVVCWLLLSLGGQVVAGEAEPGERRQEPIVIAAIFSLTGIAARHNQPLVEMIRFTVARINEQGGVLGRDLDLLVLDNKSTPIGTLEAAHQAIDAGVTAVIGAHWSSHSLAMAPLLEAAGIPMITPASTNPDVTRGRSYIFRICFLDSMQGKAMADFAIDDLKIDSVAVLHNIDERYSTDLAGYFLAEFLGKGGTVQLNAGYRGDSADYSEIIGELLKLQPQAVYIPGYTRDTALFMKQARQKGLKSIFLGGDGWDMLESLVSKEVEGSYQTVLWHPDVPYQASRDLKELHRDMSEHPIQNLSIPLAYDAVMLLVDAIRRAGTTDRSKIREALAATRDFPGAAGSITFDANGDPRDKKIIIVRYEDGKTRYVTEVSP